MFVKKREKEGVEVLMRRFFREIQLSGILAEAKKHRFFEQKPTRRERRDNAQRKNEYRHLMRGY